MLYDALIAPFTEFEVMRRALAAVIALALGGAPIGVFLMLRRMSLVGDAMAHAILPGAAIGFLLSGLNLFAMTTGGLIAGFTVAILAGVVARTTELKEDASLATFYLTSLALGVTIVSIKGTNIDLLHVLFGNILAMDDPTLLVIAFNTTVTLVVLAVIYRPLVIECVDPVFLRTVSRAGAPAHLAFLALVVVNLVNGFQALGTLLAVGLMILPAGIARFWSRDITGMICIAVVSAIVSGYAGLVLSFQTRVPSGPAIILVAAVLYIASVLFGSGSGLVRQLFPGRHLEAYRKNRCGVFSFGSSVWRWWRRLRSPARRTDSTWSPAFRSLAISSAMSAAIASASPLWSAPMAMCTSIRRRRRTQRRSPTPGWWSSTALVWRAGCRGWCNPPPARP
jgi:zinc/manganese transport system permease protein